MGISVGDCCRLFKQCKVCEEYKYVKNFPTRGGKRSRANNRKSYCWDCVDRKHEKTLSNRQEYSFDISVLSENEKITLRGRGSNNCKYETTVSFSKAKRLVEEGAAGIYHSTLIHRFFNRRSLRRFILERDQHICHYCGFFGDTIDHKTPKSNDGLSTPENCVCACLECNRRKRDIEYEEFMAINNIQHV